MTVATGAALATRRWWLLGSAFVLVLAVGIVSAAFVIQQSPGAAGGVQDGSAFLVHWQQTSVLSTATPAPVPGAVSGAVTAPTRLGAGGRSFTLAPGVAGHEAVEWTLTESVGMTLNEEVEVAFGVQYTVGGVSHEFNTVAYIESQAAAIGRTLRFNFYWDAGAATGITFGVESEISQACAAVGSCP